MQVSAKVPEVKQPAGAAAVAAGGGGGAKTAVPLDAEEAALSERLKTL